MQTPLGVGVAVINPSAHPAVSERIAFPKASQVLFPTVAVDRTGVIYEAYVDDANYQVHLAHSDNQGRTWSTSVIANAAPARVTVMPWLVAGDHGRIDLVFYGSPNPAAPTNNYGPWNGYLVQSLNADSTHPRFVQAPFTDRANHVEPVCLSGLGCTTNTGPSGDRNLGDFFTVALDAAGRAVVSFADGANQLGAEDGGVAAPSFAGFVRQASGPSLYTGGARAAAVALPSNAVTVAAHADPVPVVTPGTGAPGASVPALALRAGALTWNRNGSITVTVHPQVLNASAATSSPALPDAVYLTRWGYRDHVYFAAAEVTGGQWRFFAGQPTPVSDGLAIKYAYYPAATAVTGQVDPAQSGSVTVTVPAAVVGNPGRGATLYSVTSYALTQSAPTLPIPPGQASATDLPEIADVLPAYNAVLGAAAPAWARAAVAAAGKAAGVGTAGTAAGRGAGAAGPTGSGAGASRPVAPAAGTAAGGGRAGSSGRPALRAGWTLAGYRLPAAELPMLALALAAVAGAAVLTRRWTGRRLRRAGARERSTS